MEAVSRAEGPLQATIVVVPRERFGVARESLASLYDEPGARFELIYVDAGGPAPLAEWLAESARSRGFRLIRTGHMLSPNEARNRGLRAATTPYVVFVDNDVIGKPGWLAALLACANETGADVVTPLICQGLPLHSIVHHAGGRICDDPVAFFDRKRGEREILEVLHAQGRKVDELASHADRSETQCCEFHCVLVRRSIFERIGPLDERLLATREHLDLSLSVLQAGGRIMFEPSAVVTHLYPNRSRPLEAADWRYFMLRWSADWQRRSLRRFETKWGLKHNQRFVHRRWLGVRHYEGLVKPMLSRSGWIRRSPRLRWFIGALIARGFAQASRLLVAREDRRRRPADWRKMANSPGAGPLSREAASLRDEDVL
jgi:GT2 family glycosyltransferase